MHHVMKPTEIKLIVQDLLENDVISKQVGSFSEKRLIAFIDYEIQGYTGVITDYRSFRWAPPEYLGEIFDHVVNDLRKEGIDKVFFAPLGHVPLWKVLNLSDKPHFIAVPVDGRTPEDVKKERQFKKGVNLITGKSELVFDKELELDISDVIYDESMDLERVDGTYKYDKVY